MPACLMLASAKHFMVAVIPPKSPKVREPYSSGCVKWPLNFLRPSDFFVNCVTNMQIL